MQSIPQNHASDRENGPRPADQGDAAAERRGGRTPPPSPGTDPETTVAEVSLCLHDNQERSVGQNGRQLSRRECTRL